MSPFERPRGTRDFGPREMARRRTLEARLRSVLERFGYGEVQTPTFEHLELFTTKSGEEVVQQLYAFEDKGDRQITLRPELTAPVIRYFVSDLQAEPKPLRLYYVGNCFRYERPQSGRYREFWQFGIELIGAGGPRADAEVIAIAHACIRAAEVPRFDLRVGHIGLLQLLVERLPGDEEERAQSYRLVDKDDPGLVDHLEAMGASGPLVQAIEAVSTFEQTLDLSHGGRATRDRLAKALEPVRTALDGADLTDQERAEAEAHLEHVTSVVATLPSYDVEELVLDLGVARGLDYYTGTVFEVEAPDLGAEKQVLGGGAYTLAELLGGQPTDTAGFGLGFDRVLLVSDVEPDRTGPKVHIAPIGDEAQAPATELANRLRENGVATSLDINGRSPSKNLDFANKEEIPFVVLLGARDLEDNVATVKEMVSGDQDQVPLDQLVEHLRNA